MKSPGETNDDGAARRKEPEDGVSNASSPLVWPPTEGRSKGDGANGGDELLPPEIERHLGNSLGDFPLFALPNAWLFPGAVMPLFVFEPRYVQMVEDQLDRCGRLVIGTVCEGREKEMAGTPPIQPVAGLGEIGRHERRSDGRYVIVVIGVGRVFVRETPCDRLYRRVVARTVIEGRCIDAPMLRRRLVAAICRLAPEAKGLDAEVPIGRLADFLLLRLSPGQNVLRGVYGELDERRRAEQVLELYDARC